MALYCVVYVFVSVTVTSGEAGDTAVVLYGPERGGYSCTGEKSLQCARHVNTPCVVRAGTVLRGNVYMTSDCGLARAADAADHWGASSGTLEIREAPVVVCRSLDHNVCSIIECTMRCTDTDPSAVTRQRARRRNGGGAAGGGWCDTGTAIELTDRFEAAKRRVMALQRLAPPPFPRRELELV